MCRGLFKKWGSAALVGAYLGLLLSSTFHFAHVSHSDSGETHLSGWSESLGSEVSASESHALEESCLFLHAVSQKLLLPAVPQSQSLTFPRVESQWSVEFDFSQRERRYHLAPKQSPPVFLS